MRRWTLTLVLSAAAIAAIAVAPRLVSWSAVVARPTPPTAPMVPVAVPQVRQVPPVPLVSPPTIPEVVPVVPPVVAPPEDFWRDAVDCGMG